MDGENHKHVEARHALVHCTDSQGQHNLVGNGYVILSQEHPKHANGGNFVLFKCTIPVVGGVSVDNEASAVISLISQDLPAQSFPVGIGVTVRA